MPVSPALAEHLAAEVVGHYQEAERTLLERIARNLAKGIDGPFWAEEKYAQLLAYQRQTERLIADLQAKAECGVSSAITEAYERGGLSAAADIAKLQMSDAMKYSAVEWEPMPTRPWVIRESDGRVLHRFDTAEKAQAFVDKHPAYMGTAPSVEPLAGLRAVEAMTQETLGYVNATHPRILRSTMDLYRSVIAEASQPVLLGAQTRRQAAQIALDKFARAGITGFVSKSGAHYTLESYVETAMRTGCGKAVVQGHVDRLTANGFDLVIGSDAPRECPRCAPFEGAIMSISGATPGYPTLDDARAAGWQHCNCRHSVSLYQPGVTRPMGDVADPEGYADTTKLRYLERQTRAAKRVQAAAMDDAAAQAAGVRVRAFQAKIRAHVAGTTAKRQPIRERLGAL